MGARIVLVYPPEIVSFWLRRELLFPCSAWQQLDELCITIVEPTLGCLLGLGWRQYASNSAM
eukprot:2909184-Amphidinium_carterae.1